MSPQALTDEDRSRILGNINQKYGLDLEVSPTIPPASPAPPTPTPPPASPSRPDPLTDEDRGRILQDIDAQYFGGVAAPKKRGALGRAWDWTWTPPEFVRERIEKARKAVGDTPEGDIPASDDPEFPVAKGMAALRGGLGGAVEGVGSFLTPGDIMSFLLTGGAHVAVRGAIRSTKTLAAALGVGKTSRPYNLAVKAGRATFNLRQGVASAEEIKALTDAFNKASKTAGFAQRVEKVADIVAGGGFTYHGGDTFLEGYREDDPVKMAQGVAEGLMGGAIGGIGVIRKPQNFGQLRVSPREAVQVPPSRRLPQGAPQAAPGAPPTPQAAAPRAPEPRVPAKDVPRETFDAQRQKLGLPEPPRPEEIAEFGPEPRELEVRPGRLEEADLDLTMFKAEADAAEASTVPEPEPEAPSATREVVRVEEPGVATGKPSDKPQGLYVTPTESFDPKWKPELSGTKTTYTLDAKSLLDLTDFETPRIPLRGGSPGWAQSAGIKALFKLEGNDRALELVNIGRRGKKVLGEELAKDFPDVDWARYYDPYEMLEGYAGLRARAQGFDAIELRDNFLGNRAADEIVVLSDDALSPTGEPPAPSGRMSREGTLELATEYSREARRLKALKAETINDIEKVRLQKEIDYNLGQRDSYLQAAQTLDVAQAPKPKPGGLEPPPARLDPAGRPEPPGPGPQMLREMTARKPRSKFSPETKDHSLVDFVRAYGLRRGKRPGSTKLDEIPAELWEAMGSKKAASGLYRSKKQDAQGWGADELLVLAREEGGFNLPEDMNTGDFLALVAQDYQAKISGKGKRAHSDYGQFRGEEDLIDFYRAKQQQGEQLAATAEEEFGVTPELTDADKAAVDAFEFGPELETPASRLRGPEESSPTKIRGLEPPPGAQKTPSEPTDLGDLQAYRVTLKDGTSVEVGLIESPEAARMIVEMDYPGEVTSVHPLVKEPGKAFYPAVRPMEGKSYRVVLKDGTSVEVGLTKNAKTARELVEKIHPGEVDSVHPMIVPKPGEEGYLDFAGFVDLILGKRGPGPGQAAVDADKPYQGVIRERELRAEGPSMWSRQKQFWPNVPHDIQRRMLNKRYDLERFIGSMIDDATARQIKGDLQAAIALERHGTPDKDPRHLLDLNIGGTIGRMQVVGLDLNDIRRAAMAHNLLPQLTYYIEHRGWGRNFKIIKEKSDKAFHLAEDALHNGDNELAIKYRKKYTEYQRRIREGEVVPAGKTPESLARDLDNFVDSLTKESPASMELIERLADRYYKNNARLWKLLYDTDVISNHVYRQGLVRGPEYVPLNRIHEAFTDDPDFGGLAGLSHAIRKSLKRFEGSSLASLDPFEAAYIWGTRAVTDAARNESLRSVFHSRELAPEGLGQLIVPLRGDKAPLGFTKLAFFDKGVKRSFALPSNLAAALQTASPREVTMVNTLMQAGQQGLHVGAVGWNLAFALPNVSKDVGRAVILSKAVEPFNPKDLARFAKSWGEGLRNVIRSDEEYRDFLWSRAAGGTLAKNISPKHWVIPTWVRDKAAWRKANVPGKVLRSIPEAINTLEETTKMAAFRRLKEKGFSDVEAAIETRRYAGTPDSRKTGFDGPQMNLLLMFWNVRQQGRLFAIKRFWEDPKRLLAAFTAGSLIAMAQYKWNHQFRDDEGGPELAHVPRQERRDNFIALSDEVNPETGRHLYHKMPVPHEMKWLWIPMNDVINDFSGEWDIKTKDYIQGFMKASGETIPLFPGIDTEAFRQGPVEEVGRSIGAGLNPAVKIPLEQIANRDFHRDIPIESRGDLSIAPEERFNPRTSPTAVNIAQAMPGWAPEAVRSPKRVEHLFGSFGGASQMALELVDPISRHWSPQPELPTRSSEDIPALGVIARRFTSSGHRDQVVEDYETMFYHYYGAAAEASATYRKITSSPDETTGERLDAWFAEKPERKVLMGLQGQIQATRNILKQLTDEKWFTVNALGMDEEERTQRLLQITQNEEKVLKGAQAINEIVEQARRGETPRSALSAPPGPRQ